MWLRIVRRLTSMLYLLTVGRKFALSACRAAATAIDRYLLPASDLTANPPVGAATVDRQDRQTDRQTLDCFMTLRSTT